MISIIFKIYLQTKNDAVAVLIIDPIREDIMIPDLS